jgi:hypothetical protein
MPFVWAVGYEWVVECYESIGLLLMRDFENGMDAELQAGECILGLLRRR